MAYYYKINDSTDVLPPYKGFHLQKVKKHNISSEPNINYDFSKHVLIELLDDVTSEAKLWSEMGLIDNKNVVHKRMMIDSHRIRCRRAIVICINPGEAKQLAQRLSQTKVIGRCICAVVIQDLLSDLCLFEKQIAQFGDNRSQHQLLYVSDLSRSRGPSGLTHFLKEKFSSFGTILSILVCSDSDDYAFPEGVIKFSYLSEAFAAELALDQFVVGKERLSVTTHHNILLSQCDLRLRLRDAQWYCNIESDESSKSLFQSYIHSYNLKTVNDDSVENSLSNLHISHVSNSQNNEDSIPAFSQCNFYKKSSKNDFNETMIYIKEKNYNREQNPSVVQPVHKNSLNINDAKNNSNIVNSPIQELETHASETVPFEMSVTKIIDCVDKSRSCKPYSRKGIALNNVLSNSLSCNNKSKSSSFMTCNSLGLNFLSKKSNCKNFNTQEINSELESQPLSSNWKQLSSPLEANLNDSENCEESTSKHSKKRKKKFTPSQKLSLKSQRTGLSQNCTGDSSTQLSYLGSSQEENPPTDKKLVLRKKSDLCPTTNYKKLGHLEYSTSSRIADWLLHFPEISNEDEHLSSKKQLDSLLMEKNKLSKSKISVHKTSALKSNALNHEILYPDDENEDPNKMPLISSCQTDSIVLTDGYRSPIQMWLKNELISCTNNSVFESPETSKNIIICAMRNKDIIISVGCSHMTCESCYPESTELLLGYG